MFKSLFEQCEYIMKLIIDEPPKPLPLGQQCTASSSLFCGVVLNFQSYFSSPYSRIKAPGVLIIGSLRLSDPASMTRTLKSGFSVRREANTRPAVPPPQMMKSKDLSEKSEVDMMTESWIRSRRGTRRTNEEKGLGRERATVSIHFNFVTREFQVPDIYPAQSKPVNCRAQPRKLVVVSAGGLRMQLTGLKILETPLAPILCSSNNAASGFYHIRQLFFQPQSRSTLRMAVLFRVSW